MLTSEVFHSFSVVQPGLYRNVLNPYWSLKALLHNSLIAATFIKF